MLALWKKSMTNLDSILTNWDIILSTKVHLVKAMSCTDVRVGLEGRTSAKESMPLHCGSGEDSWEFLGQQGDQISQS